jgi:hypothetical protein
MRMPGETFRQRRGRFHKARRRVALCGTLRDDVPVTRRVRTANYSQEARWRLARAIINAREAAGHKYRPSFYKAAGISKRSLEAAESLEPNAASVGETVLHAIGRALPTWTEDTPRIILEGGPVPEAVPATQADRLADPITKIVVATEAELDEIQRIFAKWRGPSEGERFRDWANGVRAHAAEQSIVDAHPREREPQ